MDRIPVTLPDGQTIELTAGLRNVFVLEAATSYRPANCLRDNRLGDLFAGSTPGLILVMTFLDRALMRECLPEIVWETEVWCTDASRHLIHFNGERCCGPCESRT